MTRRDPIRAFTAVATVALLYWVCQYLLLPVIYFFGGPMVGITITVLVSAAIASALTLAMFDSRKLGDVGLAWHPGSGHNLSIGIALGAAGAALVVIPAVIIGRAHFQAVQNPDVSWGAALFTPLLLFCAAVGEELLFRGFSLQTLMRSLTDWTGIVLVATAFGLLHAFNPGATTLSVLNTIGFGVLFGLAVKRSHDLWLPIGMHFGWNVALPFLGVDLSGLTIRVTGYQLVWNTGDLWSGGKYGPEGSVVTSLVLILLATILWKIPVRRGWVYLLDAEPSELQPVS